MTDNSQKMRAFFAIGLNNDVRNEVVKIIKKLKKKNSLVMQNGLDRIISI